MFGGSQWLYYTQSLYTVRMRLVRDSNHEQRQSRHHCGIASRIEDVVSMFVNKTFFKINTAFIVNTS